MTVQQQADYLETLERTGCHRAARKAAGVSRLAVWRHERRNVRWTWHAQEALATFQRKGPDLFKGRPDAFGNPVQEQAHGRWFPPVTSSQPWNMEIPTAGTTDGIELDQDAIDALEIGVFVARMFHQA